MRPTPNRLVVVTLRSRLNVSDSKIYNRPRPQKEDLAIPTLMDLLMARKEKMGDAWPANLRLEPQLKKEVFKEVMPEVRSQLRRMTKER
ncbi:hypothetical protein CPC08DRAFT_685928 [Agrocybe pediades]|nr:hypothetical protein CPC08DRAFT_685928 [Agrocybe pediades]